VYALGSEPCTHDRFCAGLRSFVHPSEQASPSSGSAQEGPDLLASQ
jgi:hypothetical protein